LGWYYRATITHSCVLDKAVYVKNYVCTTFADDMIIGFKVFFVLLNFTFTILPYMNISKFVHIVCAALA